jgi:hypothetical protein
VSAASGSAAALRNRAPCFAQLGEHDVQVVTVAVVVEINRRRVQRGVLLGAPPLPVGEHIGQQQPSMGPSRWYGILPPSSIFTTVGRVTPSRSAACWVVSVNVCGATVTARPLASASTTLRSAS